MSTCVWGMVTKRKALLIGLADVTDGAVWLLRGCSFSAWFLTDPSVAMSLPREVLSSLPSGGLCVFLVSADVLILPAFPCGLSVPVLLGGVSMPAFPCGLSVFLLLGAFSARVMLDGLPVVLLSAGLLVLLVPDSSLVLESSACSGV